MKHILINHASMSQVSRNAAEFGSFFASMPSPPLENPAGTNEACNLTSKQYVINFFKRFTFFVLGDEIRGLFYLRQDKSERRQPSSKRRITSIRRNLNARVSVSYYSGYRVTLRWIQVGFFIFILSSIRSSRRGLEEKRWNVRE